FFSSRRRHTRFSRDWSSDVCSSDLDIYNTATMAQADLGLILRPGTDGALAVAVMHILLRDGLADRDYMARYTDFGPEFEAHLAEIGRASCRERGAKLRGAGGWKIRE